MHWPRGLFGASYSLAWPVASGLATVASGLGRVAALASKPQSWAGQGSLPAQYSPLPFPTAVVVLWGCVRFVAQLGNRLLFLTGQGRPCRIGNSMFKTTGSPDIAQVIFTDSEMIELGIFSIIYYCLPFPFILLGLNYSVLDSNDY